MKTGEKNPRPPASREAPAPIETRSLVGRGLHAAVAGYNDTLAGRLGTGHRVRQTYDFLLDILGRPKIDPDHVDLYRYPRITNAIQKLHEDLRKSPMAPEALQREFLEDLDSLREAGVVEIVPMLATEGRDLLCSEYIVIQARNENVSLPLEGYLRTAMSESTRAAEVWARQSYRVDMTRVGKDLEAENPRYILYLPYYQIMNAYRTPYETMLRARMVAAKELDAGRAFMTIHDRYGLYFLQHVYHRIAGNAVQGGSALTIDLAGKNLVHHPYAWATGAINDHLSVYRMLGAAFRKKLNEFDSIFGVTENREFQDAYRAYLGTDTPDPRLTRNLIAALFRVFGSSFHGERFEFFRNVALEMFDHARTIEDLSEKEKVERRGALVMDCARRIAEANGWAILEDVIEAKDLEACPDLPLLIGESARTGVHLLRSTDGRRITTLAAHERNFALLQTEAEHLARRGDLHWLVPLQALYLESIQNPARSSEVLHHAVAAHYKKNQELLYWGAMPLFVRLWLRFWFWLTRRKHLSLAELENNQERVLARRDEEQKKFERADRKAESRRIALSKLIDPEHPGEHLTERRGPDRARPGADQKVKGARYLQQLIEWWESDRWEIPVTRELPGIFGESLEAIKRELGPEYRELPLRGSDRVLIPHSYLEHNRERLRQRINAFCMKYLDGRGEFLASVRKELSGVDLDQLRKKITFLENVAHAIGPARGRG